MACLDSERRPLRHRGHVLRLLGLLWAFATPAPAATLSFTVVASEPVTVTGTPRIAVDVGGVARHATYASGSGTAALTFSYAVEPGDFDANGITLAAPLDLNGGDIADIAGNPVSPLTFTLPDTSALKVQTYTAAFTTSPITNANANDVSFAIAKAPVGAAFTYAITSSGGAGSVTGSGTISGSPHSVTGIDVSVLPSGMLTLSVTMSTTAGGTGAARTATATPVFEGALNEVPAAAAAYSVRRLQGGYGGPLLRVRRSADNAERDIGATLAGNLDAAALTGFCGADTCLVRTWYDQSSNGRHMNQPGTVNQPVIVTGGVLETEGARAALRFPGGNRFLDGPVMTSQTLTSSVNAVARCTDTSVNRHVYGDRSIGPAQGRQLRALAGGGSYLGANIGGATVTLSGATTQQRIITLLSGNAGMSGALDGVLTTGSSSTFYETSTFPYRIGGGGPGQGGGDWIGTISEVILFDSTLATAARQSLEGNQGAYYGLPGF